MAEESTSKIDNASEITTFIVNALSENGLATDEYQLHQFVDPEALAQFLDSVEGPYHISFPVRDREVIVTETGVSVQHNQALN